MGFNSGFKGLNPICHLLALFGAHNILHVSRIRVNFKNIKKLLFLKKLNLTKSRSITKNIYIY